ncbi:MAG TPA: hypothetical protein VFO58_23080 [Vicinamibacterales bacterium]|nr:hypothetical protein [Vicinamibacterales bacterium]
MTTETRSDASTVRAARPAFFTDIGIAVFGVLLFQLVVVSSSRLTANGGFGWDGESYAGMVANSLASGNPNTQMRPLLVLLTRVPYALGLDLYHSFVALDYVYAFGLYLAASLLLAHAGLTWPVRAVLVVNLALSIGTSKMYAFYPTLIDFGALALVTWSFYLSTTDRHRLAGLVCILAAAAREFGVPAALYGMHRAFRQRGWANVAMYVPSLVTFALIRWRVSAAFAGGPDQGPLDLQDAIDRLALWASPWFPVMFAYFTTSVFGGISALLVLRLRWCIGRLRAEPELATLLALVGAGAVAAGGDVWRYLVFAMPAAVALAGRYLAGCEPDLRRRGLIAVTAVTVITQRPFELMDRAKYFLDWFPLYYVLDLLEPIDTFVPVWAGRLLVMALLLVALYFAAVWTGRRSHVPAAGNGSPSSRGWTLDVLAVLALAAVASWPVQRELQAPEPPTLEAGARDKVGWETENRRVLQGDVPLIESGRLAPQSQLARPQTLLLYPPHLVLRFVPIALFFPVSLALHAWLAGLGGYMVARQLRVPRLASLAAGVAVMGGGVLMPVADPFSDGVQQLAWMPLALALTMRSTARGGVWPHPALVAIVAIGLLSGSLRGAMYVIGTAGAWYLFDVLVPVDSRPRHTAPARQFAMLCALGAGLCAVVLLPAFESALSSDGAGGVVSLVIGVGVSASTASAWFSTEFADYGKFMRRTRSR